jgi:hypothetical protein
LPIVLIGVIVDFLEIFRLIAKEEWLLDNIGILEEGIPLLHDLVAPHV